MREWLNRVGPAATTALRSIHWNQQLSKRDGLGMRVALLDSGICWAHPMFEGARIRIRDFAGSHSVNDSTGHGTANTSLLVAQGHGWIRGLAPGCDLFFAKVLGTRDRHDSINAIVEGLDWAIAKGAHVIVLPLGTRHGSGSVAKVIRKAVAHGSKVFAAAGNYGPNELCFPASLPEVTAVSALCLDGRPYNLCSSNRHVDVFAPGQDVPAVRAEGRTLLQGSSPAAVLAAGVEVLRSQQSPT